MIFLKSVKWRKGLSLSATFLFMLLVSVACKKEQTLLGKDQIDEEDAMNSFGIDTFSLKTYSVFNDSVNSRDSYYNLLGSYNDPIFGEVNAGFITQLRLSGLNPVFGDLSAITIDSVVLGLQYGGNASYYGDLSSQTVEVYQISQNLHSDTSYFGFSPINYYSSDNLVVPGTEVFTPDPITNTVIDTTKVPAQLRIHLLNSLAEDLMQHNASNPSDFSNQTDFVNYFKGLYIKTANGSQLSGKGGVFYFDTKTALSKLTIYYKQGSDKKQFDFLINSDCVDFNKVNVSRTNSNSVQKVIDNIELGQTEFYAQAYGVKAKIDIPGLDNISKKTIIHRAELVLPVQYQTGSKYSTGDYVKIQRIASKDNPSAIVDYSTKGYYDVSRKAFVIDLKTYVQSVVSGVIENTGIFVLPDYYNESMDRIIFNGPNTINKSKPKLSLKYTEF